jgi:hypothetical protein
MYHINNQSAIIATTTTTTTTMLPTASQQLLQQQQQQNQLPPQQNTTADQNSSSSVVLQQPMPVRFPTPSSDSMIGDAAVIPSEEIWDMDSNTVKRYTVLEGAGVNNLTSDPYSAYSGWPNTSSSSSAIPPLPDFHSASSGFPPSSQPSYDFYNSSKAAAAAADDLKRPKSYQCDACDKWFTSSGHLKRHFNTTLHKNAMRQKGGGVNGNGSMASPGSPLDAVFPTYLQQQAAGGGLGLGLGIGGGADNRNSSSSINTTPPLDICTTTSQQQINNSTYQQHHHHHLQTHPHHHLQQQQQHNPLGHHHHQLQQQQSQPGHLLGLGVGGLGGSENLTSVVPNNQHTTAGSVSSCTSSSSASPSPLYGSSSTPYSNGGHHSPNTLTPNSAVSDSPSKSNPTPPIDLQLRGLGGGQVKQQHPLSSADCMFSGADVIRGQQQQQGSFYEHPTRGPYDMYGDPFLLATTQQQYNTGYVSAAAVAAAAAATNVVGSNNGSYSVPSPTSSSAAAADQYHSANNGVGSGLFATAANPGSASASEFSTTSGFHSSSPHSDVTQMYNVTASTTCSTTTTSTRTNTTTKVKNGSKEKGGGKDTGAPQHGEFRCHECNKFFNRICYLKQHNKTFHNGEKPVSDHLVFNFTSSYILDMTGNFTRVARVGRGVAAATARNALEILPTFFVCAKLGKPRKMPLINRNSH